MKNLLAVCLATAIVLSVGTTELEGMKRITVEKTCIPAEQLRTWDGAELYQNLCSTCHGDTGLGDGPAARELALQPANLTLLARESGGRYPSQAVFSSISGRHVSTDLHLDMPRWEDVFRRSVSEPAEARHLIYLVNKHVRSLQVDR